jgi:magnesium-transporting ATPase (P-type)
LQLRDADPPIGTRTERGGTVVQAPPAGLTEREAATRLAAAGGPPSPTSSRSYASIVRANVFTLFNLILAVFGALTLTFGDWRDALFLGILVANSGIGIAQEVRAKRSLDRLALLVAPHATVVRDGAARSVGAGEVVEGDLVNVQAGDQVVGDGSVLEARGLQLDESILTGESDAVEKSRGDELRSGSFVSAGTGSYRVTAVGEESYAGRLTGEARTFRHPRSPLERAVNRLLLALVGAVVVLGGLLGYSLWHRDAGVREAVSTSTAGVVSLIPEGLVLLVSVTYAVAAVRMARRGVLAQQLNAIESLASADVICLDKTGTLTEAALRTTAAIPAAGVDDLERQLARYGASSSLRNGTLEAIAAGYPGEREPVLAEVAFDSRRKWSAVQFPDVTLVLGAPENFRLGDLAEAAKRERREGRRVVALGRSSVALPDDGDEPSLPNGLGVLGLVVLAERLRPNIRDTVAFFQSEDIELKVLSGDNPETVAAIATDVGIHVRAHADGRELPSDPDGLRRAALETDVIGRVSPADKRRVVEALRDAGRYVAMVGDGVNDVPALKASRLAIAQGSGTQMAKSVADLVLLHGDFAEVPELVAQGRQALRNLQRVARLYVAKSGFAGFLILMIGITSTAYPLLPRHFTIAATLTIGIPTFFLALAPSSGPWRPEGFARRVARFAVPAGALTGVGVVASYLFALHDLDLPVREARTVATSVLVLVGLYLVLLLEHSGRRLRRNLISLMCVALAGVYVLALALPVTRRFFELATPTPAIVLTALVGAALSMGCLYLAHPGDP